MKKLERIIEEKKSCLGEDFMICVVGSPIMVLILVVTVFAIMTGGFASGYPLLLLVFPMGFFLWVLASFLPYWREKKKMENSLYCDQLAVSGAWGQVRRMCDYRGFLSQSDMPRIDVRKILDFTHIPYTAGRLWGCIVKLYPKELLPAGNKEVWVTFNQSILREALEQCDPWTVRDFLAGVSERHPDLVSQLKKEMF